jgi:hypothetical protein
MSNERLVTLSVTLVNPTEGAGLGDLECYIPIPFNCTLVHVTASAREDDSGFTLDVHDDGSAIVTALSAADADVPGEWASTHTGGSNTPVRIAAGSEISFDANGAANANVMQVVLWLLTGEVVG